HHHHHHPQNALERARRDDMLLYTITDLHASTFDRDTTLRAPLRTTERAENTNGDRHVLYADRDGEGLVWRRAGELSEDGQRRRGGGPVVARAQVSREERPFTRPDGSQARVRRGSAVGSVVVTLGGEGCEYRLIDG